MTYLIRLQEISKAVVINRLFVVFTILIASSSISFAGDLRVIKDISHVCMVNNMDMGKPQLKVMVGGKAYYGCCKMCVKTLNEDRSSRYAVDPVSRKEVDKAVAVVGANSNNEVFYFENEENMKRFLARQP